MTAVFADSSALVKLYANEHGSATIRALDGPIIVSSLARVEVPAAIWRKYRIGELDADDAAVLVQDFESDYFQTDLDTPRYIVMSTDQVLDHAARIAAVHQLRAYDAVQLGSALCARDVAQDCLSIAAYDAQLRSAARREGFQLIPAAIDRRESTIACPDG